MRLRGVALRVFAAAAAWLAGAGLTPSTGTAAASTPTLLWRDVATVRILCLVVTEAGVDHGRLHDEICARSLALASAGAPVPVELVGLGDPAVLAPDAVTLLVHVMVEPGSDGRLAAVSVRPYRNSADLGGMLFGAAPRAVRLPSSDATAAALHGPLRRALSETLPWLAGSGGPRPINH